MKRTFKETPTFTNRVDCYADKELLKDIQDAILNNPSIGSTVAGTGLVLNLNSRCFFLKCSIKQPI
jgi:hypothetical protein